MILYEERKAISMKQGLSKIIDVFNKIIIILLLLLSVFNIISPFFIFHSSKNLYLIHYFEMHRTIARLFSFIILIVAWKLYKRVSTAWTITMAALSVIIIQNLMIYHHHILKPWILIEIIIYFVLLFSKNYYCRKMDHYSFKKAVIIYMAYAAFVFLNAAISFFRFREWGILSLSNCIKQTIDIIFNFDNLNLMIFSQSILYHRFIFCFSWFCIFAGVILMLTPLISVKIQTQEQVEKARKLVKKYGQNCSSYLTLEKDKNLYFGKTVEGFIAYGVVDDILIVLGEPICAPEDFLALLTEFKNYCINHAYNLLVLNATSVYLHEYEKLGMGCIKCGEEPRFYLKDYSLAGGKASKVRLNINHATKAGIRILEYKPLNKRNIPLEKQIMEVSQEWFSLKKSSELVFTMGTVGFESPMDRRYFYAVDEENKVEGFMVFVPYDGMNGYMADVTRHRSSATRGVMEKIFYEALMTFKEEGVEWGSLALAPLARLEEEPEMTAKLLNVIYEKMNSVYGFKTLYQTKLKYNPTCWEPAYYIYYPAVFTPAFAYAIIKIQNPLGIKDYVKAFFRNMRKEKEIKG